MSTAAADCPLLISNAISLYRASRDPGDNVFVASAAAARAEFLVTQDRDLLALQRPFGVRVVTPVELIRALRL